MHLKSLTLRGFKSFASATTLRFEPGITAVVGPNGSGKSNVVDALAWVMGEQGAKSLRGGKMEDVIFAGTSGRAPLGRAEVSLTIDNADGALPIAYSEVTVTRTLFRNGGSEYQINGSACRLLDVQELLSDSGIGREMHVIVGQGQLDAVLSATPEDRRGFIEEAAGVLKHRKRKEKALRKLDAMQGNLTRLQDLTGELRRQLKPLGRQAEVARRAQTVQADARDARLRLLADDLVQLTAQLEADVADERAVRARRAQVEEALAAARTQEAELEARAQAEAPRAARAQETWYALSSLRERLTGTAGLAGERLRGLVRQLEAPPERGGEGRDPDAMEQQAARVREEEAGLLAAVGTAKEQLGTVVEQLRDAERALTEEERALATAVRARADRREGLARLAGQASAARSRVDAAEAELGRLASARDEALTRADQAKVRFAALETQVAGLDAGEEDLDDEHEQASAALDEIAERVEALVTEEREAERERAALTARVEALRLGLATRDGAGALLADGSPVAGVLGTAARLVEVRPGWETAVAAALGEAAEAVVVEGLTGAVSAVEHLRAGDHGRAGLLVAGAPAAATQPLALREGETAARELVSAPEQLLPALGLLLDGTVVVDDLAAAAALVEREPGLRAVTRDGDVVRAGFVRGGSSAAPSLLEVQAAVDEAERALAEASHRVERARFGLSAARTEGRAAEERVEAALARLHESDARMAAVAEELGQLGAAARAAAAEAERLATRLQSAQDGLAGLRTAAEELEQRHTAAQEAPDEGEPSREQRDRLAERGAELRRAEMEARLAVRTAEERARALAGRADALERGARQEREARQRAAERRERQEREAAVARAVLDGAEQALGRLAASLELAAEERTAADAARAAVAERLAAARSTTRGLAAELEQLVDSVHRDEVARAEQRMRVEALRQRAVEELGTDPDALVEEYGPHQLVPPSIPVPGEPEPEEEPQPHPYVRAEQEKRLRTAERALTALGKVNPLALEEFAALEERHKFLTTQLEDLKASRRDLLDIVKEVDERVQQVFTEAYADTAREFEGVFSRLFPGGEGRLVLTNPDDMLTTGIEVEARPPGKKVKRLSLLSGGERSLTAVALLVAIFKARPSPFYVMDEVEAALDDTNLGRLLVILEELRASSQLIIITHQKRTMEIADALYGVTMRGDGVTTVISQRLREPGERQPVEDGPPEELPAPAQAATVSS
ncbi:condensin subunit Smc [Motilibacter rhizosphaerae]|uniref:Chromosome partition protein Smc n=1 Tax=Motilibacter rhizosphaerae TaxID=598652 RepID=A0A4Q7NP20_9ACTN|nr:chromosome segregation protein SMC [Motilibacter rhizosphaerae]RZS86999.1 condensin subunit Smc [Motilibacter rhizosphaerae]